MSAFAAALDAIYSDPNMAVDAEWLSNGVPPGVPVRVVLRTPDGIADFGTARIIQSAIVIEVRVSDVPSPRKDDRIAIGDQFYVVQAAPIRDLQNLYWKLDVRQL